MIKSKEDKIIILGREDFPDGKEWSKKDIIDRNPFDFLKFVNGGDPINNNYGDYMIFFRDSKDGEIQIIQNSYATGDDPKLKEKYLYYGFEAIENRWDLLDL